MQRSSSSGERAAAAAARGTAGGQAAGGKRVTNAMIEVALSTDFGVNDNTHIALSHLVRYARQAAALRAARPRRAARGRRGVSAHLAAIGDACAAAQSGRGAVGGADPVARRKQMSTAAACAAVFVPYMQDRAQVEELGTLMIESAPVVLTAPLWKSLHSDCDTLLGTVTQVRYQGSRLTMPKGHVLPRPSLSTLVLFARPVPPSVPRRLQTCQNHVRCRGA